MAIAQVLRVSHTDQFLVERCRVRDEHAFSEIVARYKTSIYNYLYRMTSDAHDAEDLTQDVFIRMYTSLDSFRQQSSLKTWLFRIASNLCIDRYRRRNKHKAIAYSLDEPFSDASDSGDARRDAGDETYEPHRLFAQREMSGQIQTALDALPDKLRTVVVLFDIEGMTYDEIAQIVGCPVGTVKSRLFNARLQLRKLLSAYIAA